MIRRAAASLALLPLLLAAAEIKPIPRRLPPTGIAVPEADLDALKTRLASVRAEFAKFANQPPAVDVEIYLKAVDLAIAHGEFYKAKKDLAVANVLLDDARARLRDLAAGRTPWRQQSGRFAVGYRSTIDDSVQPYGLEIPAELNRDNPVPLYVWLHGRGAKVTDLHFIHQRQTSGGKFTIDDGIVVHPFGRQCIGFKHAGEIDVLDVIADVGKRYRVDPHRIVLMGFSMGGAGAWHIGAHFTDHFAAVHAGAGFAETAQYNKLTPENYPPTYEQTLWRVYDVPNYVRNLFNLPVVAYSGEVDKQIQAARVMEAAFADHGKTLPHLIGPKMGHRYDPKSQESILQFIRNAHLRGKPAYPEQIHWQSPTLQYNRMHWLSVDGLGQHWQDARVDARRDNNAFTFTTKNVTEFTIRPPKPIAAGTSLLVDGESVLVPSAMAAVTLSHIDNTWQLGKLPGLRKRPGLQGPIDDAFRSPFLVVTPDDTVEDPQLQQWLDFELNHFRERWRALMRGSFRQKSASQVTADDVQRYNLILWGTPATNAVLERLANQLPFTWRANAVSLNKRDFPGKSLVPQLIYPNPEAPDRYLVINSGLSFRENHDRTNSLQNPKLGDWAVIDYSEPPDGNAPGRIVDSGFFDERWQ